ncbi:MAG: energy-coupling factor transporter ATPase [Clostridiales bacterium]|nr:energy-coupling factor transporter ATPase [Clostridiales bacterium]
MSRDSENKTDNLDRDRAVQGAGICFAYEHQDSPPVQALSDISLAVPMGAHVVFIGRNGSGKSTLAKLINVLEIPDEGELIVLGRDTSSEDDFWYIRSHCGMVFQNPDNQIVGTSVEEDVAFGPENLGIPTEEIRKRVDDALKYVGLMDLADRMPSSLSGGQKQKLAIAGVLAMMPRVLILDESTAMLDPVSRNEFLELVERLRNEKGITVIHITHDMSEASRADRVFVLEKGRVVLEGRPQDIFFQFERMSELGLDVPVFAGVVISLYGRLGIPLKKEYLGSEQAAMDAVRKALGTLRLDQVTSKSNAESLPEPARSIDREDPGSDMSDFPAEEKTTDILSKKNAPVSDETIINVRNLCYAYENLGSMALEDISFSVRKGEIFSVIGHSGSGKTTLITHLNGIIRPQQGQVELIDADTGAVFSTRNNSDVKEIRKRVGLLFQYPEYQLFEETVRKDILFGPLKMGMDKETAEQNMLDAIRLVRLDESVLDRSPFELSGGQKRRVAFAGIIAMNPDILVLDEPAAGLDPVGRRDVFRYINELKSRGKTIILVSHNMDEAARISDRLLVLSGGRTVCESSPDELFSSRKKLKDYGLDLPELVMFLKELSKDYPELDLSVFDIEKAVSELIRAGGGTPAKRREPDSNETTADKTFREARND